MKSQTIFIGFLLSCLWLSLLPGCQREGFQFEENAVIVEIRVTPEEAAAGLNKDVRAPDGQVYTLVIKPGLPDKTPLKLPPSVAEKYPYPLYFRMNILAKDRNRPEDLLNRKKSP